MARIAGVDLPREKRVEIGLTYIYGIGLTTSKKILAETGINPDTRVKDLDENDVSKLREYIDHNIRVESSQIPVGIHLLNEIIKSSEIQSKIEIMYERIFIIPYINECSIESRHLLLDFAYVYIADRK